jgi:hypothetical protein
MRIAQFEALSGDDQRKAFSPPLSGSIWKPFGSYSPRGTMTSQQFRTWPLVSSKPQPRPGACVPVRVSNWSWPVPAELVTAACISLVLDSLKYWLVSMLP